MQINPEFCPRWYTIPEFAGRKPARVYHKENEPFVMEEETHKNLHVLARAEFEAPPTGPCILRISADDYYKLYVNGRFVTQGPAPGYPEHYYYNEIDLEDFLVPGKNVIAVHLYYQGLVNRVWNSGDGRLALAAELPPAGGELTWNYRLCEAYSGGTTGYETQYLENFDSRKWQKDWNRLACTGDWKPMAEAEWADYCLSLQPTQMITVTEQRPKIYEARESTEGEPAGWFIDMGEEITGALKLTAEGKAGSRLIIRCGEELDGAGNVRFEMRCNCRYEEIWTLDDGVCELEPYDYKGFRYAQIIPEEGARLLDALALVRHYPMDETACSLKSSEPLLEQIFHICKNGVRCGTQDGYLDCPTREKGQYLGDAVVTAHAQVWLTGDTAMLRKCIRQFAWTKDICPGLMGVAPGALMQEIADFSLLWSQLLLLDYRFTGDKEFLRELYPTACGVVEHFARYAREDGLLDQVADKWNLVDWPENLRDDYDFELSRPVVAPGVHNVINALYVGAVKTLSELEAILGIPVTGNWKALKMAYIHAFYRPELHRFTDSEVSVHSALHSNLYALYFDLVPEGETDAVADYMLEKGFCCGVFTSYFYLKGLARVGRYEDIYRMLLNDSEHGWVNMIKEGATSCMEAWGRDQKWNTSLCHPWASAPIPVIVEDLAGLYPDPDCPQGFRFEPHLPKKLDFFRLEAPFCGRKYVIEKADGGENDVSVFSVEFPASL